MQLSACHLYHCCRRGSKYSIPAVTKASPVEAALLQDAVSVRKLSAVSKRTAQGDTSPPQPSQRASDSCWHDPSISNALDARFATVGSGEPPARAAAPISPTEFQRSLVYKLTDPVSLGVSDGSLMHVASTDSLPRMPHTLPLHSKHSDRPTRARRAITHSRSPVLGSGRSRSPGQRQLPVQPSRNQLHSPVQITFEAVGAPLFVQTHHIHATSSRPGTSQSSTGVPAKPSYVLRSPSRVSLA